MDGEDWTDKLFVRHAGVFLAVHEHGWAHGEEQAQDLVRVFERFGIAPGGRVLDAPCGIGRHATRLAKLGYRVVGVDMSPLYVARARELAMQEGVSEGVSYVVGDLRKLGESLPQASRPFDVAMNLWTSIGYYDDDTDVRILRGYADLVRPGGLLLLDCVNRDFLVRRFDPQGREAFGEIVQIEQRHLDLKASRMQNECRLFRRSGEDLVHVVTIPIDHRVYALHELMDLMQRGGWHVEGTFGGLKMEPSSFEAPRLFLVGRR